MTRSSLGSIGGVLAATVVVALATSLLGCASLGPVTPVAVSDLGAVAGTWKGIVYRTGFEPDSVTLTIHDDGSYDVVSMRPGGTSSGTGTIVVSDGRLLVDGRRGQGAGTLLTNSAGDRVLDINMTLTDNSTLMTKLWPTR